MSARGDILQLVVAALKGVAPATTPPPAPRQAPAADRIAHFMERVDDYRATVVRGHQDELQRLLAAALPAGTRVVVAPGLPRVVAEALPPFSVDDGLTASEIDQRFDAVVTSACLGIAETGTIVLDHGPGQGRRVLTLIPDEHVCVLEAHQVVDDVPDAVAQLDPSRPQTWISGPSATSDIELDRVEGVHGPRKLTVIVIDIEDASTAAVP